MSTATIDRLTDEEVVEWDRQAKAEGDYRADWRAYRTIRSLAREVMAKRRISVDATVTVPCPFETGNGPCEEDIKVLVMVTPGEPATRDYPGTETTCESSTFAPCQHNHDLTVEQMEQLYADAAERARDAEGDEE